MNELTVILIAGVAMLTGSYLIFRPQSYKDEMRSLGHLLGKFSPWAIRVLGFFIVGAAICFIYVATKSKSPTTQERHSRRIEAISHIPRPWTGPGPEPANWGEVPEVGPWQIHSEVILRVVYQPVRG